MARLVYLGTPELAVAPLRTLVHAGHRVELVVTRPDKRRGRGGAVVPSPVKAAALELGIPVTDDVDEVVGAGAEVGVVVAYGRIIPSSVLDELAMVNLHFSLLPRWRGAAPVERAILEGDRETGVSLMAVERGLDTGAVYAASSTAIGADETAAELTGRLVALGCELLEQHLGRGRASLPVPHAQQGTPTYAEKISSSEFELRWELPAVQLHRVIRLGRAWTTFRGHRLRILRAEAEADVEAETARVGTTSGDGWAPAVPVPPAEERDVPPGTLERDRVVAGDGHRIRMLVVQPEGRRAMPATDWLHGAGVAPGERLGA